MDIYTAPLFNLFASTSLLEKYSKDAKETEAFKRDPKMITRTYKMLKKVANNCMANLWLHESISEIKEAMTMSPTKFESIARLSVAIDNCIRDQMIVNGYEFDEEHEDQTFVYPFITVLRELKRDTTGIQQQVCAEVLGYMPNVVSSS